MVLWVTWAGCVDEPTAPLDSVPSFVALAEAGGYTVGVGAVRPFDYSVCCEPGISCLHNNPSTPYQFVRLPPAPGQETPEIAADETGRSSVFRLRPDEAIVQIGRTPPARYYSWRSYLVTRAVGEGRAPYYASLGPSLNNMVIAERQQVSDAAARPFAVVTTMDAAVERRVAAWLVEAGIDPWEVQVDRIPPELVQPGLDPEDDTFLIMIRAALFASDAARDAWVADPETTAYRLTPDGPEASAAEPHAVQPLPPQGSGTTEDGYRAALDALGQAIRAAYPDRLAFEAVSEPAVFPTYHCVPGGHCAFENWDRYYAALPPTLLPENHFVVAYGVNHARSGKATYANVAVSAESNHLGIGAVESDRMVGSARVYLPDHPAADDLYAAVIARTCAPFPGQPCIEVPEGCPGVALDGEAKIDFRAYLEPATGSGPLPAEILPDRGLLFGPPQ